MSPKIFNENLMKYRSGRNPELDRSLRSSFGSMAPGKILKGDSDEILCSCGGARAAAIKCLRGMEGDFSELAEKKRKCASEILSDPTLKFHLQ